MRRACAALAAAAGALLLASCGETKLDTSGTERDVKTLIQEQGASLDGVSCPDEVKAGTGTRFECTATTSRGNEIAIPLKVVGEGKVDLAGRSAVRRIKDEIILSELVDRGAKDPKAICTYTTEALLRQFGSLQRCERAARRSGTDRQFKISSIEIDGDVATVEGTGQDGPQRLKFERGRGGWLYSGGV
jgi:uncharacterized protein DUF4333